MNTTKVRSIFTFFARSSFVVADGFLFGYFVCWVFAFVYGVSRHMGAHKIFVYFACILTIAMWGVFVWAECVNTTPKYKAYLLSWHEVL